MAVAAETARSAAVPSGRGAGAGAIADILGVSANSVEVRLHRAKINLQKKLASLLS